MKKYDEYGDAQSRPQESGPLFLHPDDDLAPNRPGETLHAALASAGAARRPGLARAGRALGRLVGRPDRCAVWRGQLAGQQRVGEELERRTGGGWRVLHSVPLPPDTALAHLLIGPGGVFALYTAHHPGAHLGVGEEMVRIGRRRAEPYVRRNRRQAVRASLALSTGCGFAVKVRPVLALVAAAEISVAPELYDVRVVREGDLAGLGEEGAVFRPDEVATVYGVARDRRTWLAV